jgi:hypothetical protein
MILILFNRFNSCSRTDAASLNDFDDIIARATSSVMLLRSAAGVPVYESPVEVNNLVYHIVSIFKSATKLLNFH